MADSEYLTKAELDVYSQILKAHLGISSDNDFQALQDVIIAMVRQKIDTYTGRNFQSQNYTSNLLILSVGGNDRNIILIPGPVVGGSQDPDDDITLVEVRGGKADTFDTLNTENWSIEIPEGIGSRPTDRFADRVFLMKTGLGSSEFQRNAMNPRSTAGRRFKSKWAAGHKNVRITYTAGFASVPDVVRDIALEMTDNILQELVNKFHGTMYSQDDPRMKNLVSTYQIPDPIKRSLRPFMTLRGQIGIVGA